MKRWERGGATERALMNRTQQNPYLVGVGGIWAWVLPQFRELLLQPGVGGVAQTVDDTGGQEDPNHGHDRDQGQHDERGRVLLLCSVWQKLEFAFLQNRREGARVST